MPSTQEAFDELSGQFTALLNSSPAEAVSQARKINFGLDKVELINLMILRATTLVDGGALTQQQDAIEEGVTLLRELHAHFPTASINYSLANGLIAAAGPPPVNGDWLGHRESTRELRAEARPLFWKVAQDTTARLELRTQAWTNLANEFSNNGRYGEAHDGWLEALEIDAENGVAASSAARNLLWLYQQGGCSKLTLTEAIMLAKVAARNLDRVFEYAGAQAAHEIAEFASQLPDPPLRLPHTDPFIGWVERERLTLAPVVELVDPSLGKLDWLMLPGIMEHEPGARGMPPPVFAMFNMLKSDFILARDLLWRAINQDAWPSTGRFADTLDYATYGPGSSMLILAHRTALDLLDKVGVTANHYFELGARPDKVIFSTMWRDKLDKATGAQPLAEKVKKAILSGTHALYGLVELADDYHSITGILRAQKDLRNAGTHRFIVLHDMGDPAHCRQAPEVEHHRKEAFTQEVLRALKVARSAIQMLAFSIWQHEQGLEAKSDGLVGMLFVPDHDWIRGEDDEA